MNVNDLNKAFDNRVRLGIMSALVINKEINFNTFKELLQLTDGNLASHLKSLEEYGYIEVKKNFIGRKTNTTYLLTQVGEEAFNQHLNALENLLNQVR